MITFTVPGQPVPKERPRRGKNGQWYTPKKTKDYERKVGWYARQARVPLLYGPLTMRIDITPADRRRRDDDNIEKALKDALNGIAYADDRQVADTRIVRHDPNPDNPHVVIRLSPIPKEVP